MEEINKNEKKPYDLEERTAKFGEQIITFCQNLPSNSVTTPIINQLVRAGTSIGANYCEADEASSKKDFINKLYISIKETKETKFWLRMAGHTVPNKKEEARRLWKEAQELNLIIASIIRKAKKKKDDSGNG